MANSWRLPSPATIAERLEDIAVRLEARAALYRSGGLLDTSPMARDNRTAVDRDGTLVIQRSTRIAWPAGAAHVTLAAARPGLLCITRGTGVWLRDSGAEHAFAPGSVLCLEAQRGERLSFATPAEAFAVCLERSEPASELARRLLPHGTLVHARGPACDRLHHLISLLELFAPASALSSASPALACALEALIWSVAAERGPAPTEVGDPVIRRAAALLGVDLARRLDVAALAKRVGLSRAALVRRFSAAVGLPPEKYLTWLRMRHASQLLRTSEASLAEIAAVVGYASEFTFSRAFRRWCGVAPGAYRLRPRAGARVMLASAA